MSVESEIAALYELARRLSEPWPAYVAAERRRGWDVTDDGRVTGYRLKSPPDSPELRARLAALDRIPLDGVPSPHWGESVIDRARGPIRDVNLAHAAADLLVSPPYDTEDATSSFVFHGLSAIDRIALGRDPFRISGTGTLPHGLRRDVDYHVSDLSLVDRIAFGHGPRGTPEDERTFYEQSAERQNAARERTRVNTADMVRRLVDSHAPPQVTGTGGPWPGEFGFIDPAGLPATVDLDLTEEDPPAQRRIFNYDLGNVRFTYNGVEIPGFAGGDIADFAVAAPVVDRARVDSRVTGSINMTFPKGRRVAPGSEPWSRGETAIRVPVADEDGNVIDYRDDVVPAGASPRARLQRCRQDTRTTGTFSLVFCPWTWMPSVSGVGAVVLRFGETPRSAPLHVPDCPRTNDPPTDPCVCEHWDVERDTIEGGGGVTALPAQSKRLTRTVLGELGARYCAPAGRSYNRHDARRWLRAFRRCASVASDALQQSDRVEAIKVLLEMVGIDDAIRLTERPPAPEPLVFCNPFVVGGSFLMNAPPRLPTVGEPVAINDRGELVPAGTAGARIFGTVVAPADGLGRVEVRIDSSDLTLSRDLATAIADRERIPFSPRTATLNPRVRLDALPQQGQPVAFDADGYLVNAIEFDLEPIGFLLNLSLRHESRDETETSAEIRLRPGANLDYIAGLLGIRRITMPNGALGIPDETDAELVARVSRASIDGPIRGRESVGSLYVDDPTEARPAADPEAARQRWISVAAAPLDTPAPVASFSSRVGPLRGLRADAMFVDDHEPAPGEWWIDPGIGIPWMLDTARPEHAAHLLTTIEAAVRAVPGVTSARAERQGNRVIISYTDADRAADTFDLELDANGDIVPSIGLGATARDVVLAMIRGDRPT